jgi:hypothetical protein
MKKVMVFLGWVVLLAALASGIGLIVATLRGPGLDQESRRFVDEAVPAIIGAWSEQALIDRAAPELLQETDRTRLQKLFATYRRLGALKEYRGADGDSNFTVSPDGVTVSALYFSRATFEAGAAVIRVAVLKREGTWLIRGFRVESDVFLAPEAEESASPVAAMPPEPEPVPADTSAPAGAENFEDWCRRTLSSTGVRYQSPHEIWIAMSDSYGPYPNRELASQAATMYLSFERSVDSVKVVLFRSNEKIAEATVDRTR